MKRSLGIVLFYKGRNISIFEEQKGRIDALLYMKPTAHSRVQKGSVISYSVSCNNYQESLLQDVQVEHVPLLWAKDDIYFLHYLLELCYYFIPQGNSCPTTFSFFMNIFSQFSSFVTVLHKKRVLCKFFSQLGMYPYDSEIQQCVEQLLKMPIDNLMDADLQLASEDLCDQWINWCIQTHPQGKWFKAMPTLLKSD